MRNIRIAFVGFVVVGFAGMLVAQSQSPVQPAEIKGETHSITLPQIAPPPLPDGPNKEKFEIDCSTCHSLRYMTMQPR
ncbi:MAG TPA: hypothetical protein VN541_05810, partial [Tepidisphaeraceae bacterium]|nr:hypothetical protein [Tepidisphaeraceae bacterium]